MNNYAKELLTDNEILLDLRHMILEKVKYIDSIKDCYEKLKSTYNGLQTDEATKNFIKVYLFEFRGGRHVLEEEKSLNNMCLSYAEATDLLSTQKYFTNWRDIQEKIDRIDITDLVSKYVPIKNPRFNIKCPLHEDKRPSLKIYPNTNSWFCFGCQKGGKPVNFVMEIGKLSYKEAVKHLLNIFY